MKDISYNACFYNRNIFTVFAFVSTMSNHREYNTANVITFGTMYIKL